MKRFLMALGPLGILAVLLGGMALNEAAGVPGELVLAVTAALVFWWTWAAINGNW